MAVNAHLDDYPQGGFPAVTVSRIDFRVLPTRDRHSRIPKRPGGDNPFDNLQESSAPPGTPVLVTPYQPRPEVASHGDELRPRLGAGDGSSRRWMRSSCRAGRAAGMRRSSGTRRPSGMMRASAFFRAPLGAVFPKDGRGRRLRLDPDGGARRPGEGAPPEGVGAKGRDGGQTSPVHPASHGAAGRRSSPANPTDGAG